jgi:hypothetical protein
VEEERNGSFVNGWWHYSCWQDEANLNLGKVRRRSGVDVGIEQVGGVPLCYYMKMCAFGLKVCHEGRSEQQSMQDKRVEAIGVDDSGCCLDATT